MVLMKHGYSTMVSGANETWLQHHCCGVWVDVNRVASCLFGMRENTTATRRWEADAKCHQ